MQKFQSRTRGVDNLQSFILWTNNLKVVALSDVKETKLIVDENQDTVWFKYSN